nr:hypothetical protein [Tanacetum cinerariifolium]
PKWFSQPRRPPTPDRDWNKTFPAAQGNAQSWISELASVDTLTPELLAGPTFELMRGSYNSLTELEYHLEEVYKATTNQLDWVNPEGQQYPHNLLQPLPLIPDNRGRRVIPFEHFINNDLEYLRGGTPFGEFLTGDGNVSSSMGSQLTENLLSMYTPRGRSSLSPSSRLWNSTTISIWIRFRYVVMMTRFTNLKNAISKGYASKTLKICCYSSHPAACGRSSIGGRKLPEEANLTKPDTYRSDLKRREAYTAYSNPRGFIYQTRTKKQIDADR